MNRLLCKFLTIAFLFSICFVFTSCNSRTDHFYAEIKSEDNKISANPTEAFFENDGSFTVKVGIINKLPYPKYIDKMQVTLKDNQDVLIVDGTLEMKELVIIKPGESTIVPCSFREDELKVKSPNLKVLKSSIVVTYYGAVTEAKNPEVKKDSITANVNEAYFTRDGSMKGKLRLMNNFSKAVTMKSITFNVKDNTGKVYAKNKLVITSSAVIDSNAVISLDFIIAPDNITAKNINFDTLSLDYTVDIVK